MVAVITALAAFTALSAVYAAPWDPKGQGRNDLNPYADDRKLVFENGKFKLLLISDLHYAERESNLAWADWSAINDAKSTDVIDKALSDEKPHFVVFGGDQVAGENQLWENSTLFLDQMLSPIKKHKVPVASVYGNHDESYNVSHGSLYRYEKEKSVAKDFSWTQVNEESSGDPKGAYNYYIPVYSTKKSKIPSLLLWFFDSRSGTFNSPNYHKENEPWMTQDWVDPIVATWINSTADAMRKQWGELPKSLAFVHIPPTPAQTIGNNSVGTNHTGINFDVPVNTQGGSGPFWQNVDVDLPFWHAVTGTIGGKDGSGLISITSGHDHGNDWCERDEKEVGPYTFCFARHSGYGGYGNWARGSRVFEAILDPKTKHDKQSLSSVKSWIRMEDHSTANSTILVEQGKTTLINTGLPA